MTKQTYEDFATLRTILTERQECNLAEVFVPVGPEPHVGTSLPLRLLFVGRATRGYDEVPSYEDACERDAEIFVSYKSPFWSFIYRVTLNTLERIGAGPVSDLTTICGWTNLAKIGDTKGNPTAQSLSIQASLCCEALHAEIALMNPDAVVIMTGDYGNAQIFGPVFGLDGWMAGQSPTRFKRHAKLGTFLVHTYHPERKKGSREMAIAIGGLIADAVRMSG